MAGATAQSPQSAALQAAQQNALARNLILQNSVTRIQQIANGTVNAANQSQINVQPRNVGLIRGFIVSISAVLTAASATAANLTGFGPANLLSQITLTDLQNNTRIQTAGWHLHLLNTARAMRPFGFSPFAANTLLPIAYGNNFGEISAPQSIADVNPHTVTMRYYVPCAYAQDDLRGAIYAAVTNATMNLQLTVNTNAFVGAGADATLGVYSGNTGSVGNVTYAVYQVYEDQLPMGQQGPILPIQDLSTIYELKNTSVNGLTVGNDFPVAYSNFRSYLSTFAVYDNGGTLNAGTDINYLALQSANFTNIWKMDPTELALLSMTQLGVDWPKGVYYASHRQRPINTSQFGNMELIVNPSTVNANAQLLIGYEDFAQMSILNQAGSLPAG